MNGRNAMTMYTITFRRTIIEQAIAEVEWPDRAQEKLTTLHVEAWANLGSLTARGSLTPGEPLVHDNMSFGLWKVLDASPSIATAQIQVRGGPTGKRKPRKKAVPAPPTDIADYDARAEAVADIADVPEALRR